MGGANGPETRCNASLWQGREASDYSRPEGILRSFAGLRGWRQSIPWQQKARAASPGLFVINTGNDQAAGL